MKDRSRHLHRGQRVLRAGDGHQAARGGRATTSWCSSAATTSAAPGTSTPTPAAAATCPPTSTRSRSRPTPSGRRPTRSQPEIRAYLQRVADDFGVRPYVELQHHHDRRRLGRGRRALDRRDRPRHAARPRADHRHGPAGRAAHARHPRHRRASRATVMHSARWDDSVELEGKRVASIGTGASAIQYVPEVRKEAEKLHVFQRTAPWVLPHTNREIKRLGEAPLQALPGRCSGSTAPASTPCARRLVLGMVKNAASCSSCWSASRAGTSRARSRTPSCARRSRRTTTSAASGSCPRTSGTRRCRPTTSSWSPRASRRSSPTRSSTRTASSARSTCCCSAPASRWPTCRWARWSRAARARRSTRPGTAARGRCSARPRPTSPTCSCCSARTPGWGTTRWST